MRFIDYMLRPEVIAAITNAVSYPNPNLAATALVEPEIRDDPGIYPPAGDAAPALSRSRRRRAPTSGRARGLEPRQIGLLSGPDGAAGDHRGEQDRSAPTAAVDDVSLTVERGEFFALLGPSGCGKTTLLRMIAGFETPDSGRIVIDGVDVTGVPPYARPVNMMFQSYALFPHLDVAGNIAFGLRQEGMERRRREPRGSPRCWRWCRCRITRGAARTNCPAGSGSGSRWRARLAKMPKLLLLDEPLAALDRKLRAETRLELTGIQERVGTTFLVVTHDQEEALGMATRIAVMDRGRLVQTGAPAEIYERPAFALCRRFRRRGEFVRGRARRPVQRLASPLRVCRSRSRCPPAPAPRALRRPWRCVRKSSCCRRERPPGLRSPRPCRRSAIWAATRSCISTTRQGAVII